LSRFAAINRSLTEHPGRDGNEKLAAVEPPGLLRRNNRFISEKNPIVIAAALGPDKI
jgi:hypothetical protein